MAEQSKSVTQMRSLLQPHLTRLVESLPEEPTPEQLNELVKKTLSETHTNLSAENCKSQWEHLLRESVLNLACTEGRALKEENTKYYAQLQRLLDVVLTFSELGACDQSLPFTVLQDLLETQTIASCSHIFSWIEARAARLTEELVPQKGKALILLRALNDLLRRLSKTGKTTIFCGRILTLLSGVFPLGERSGVNLRGEYGPAWEGVKTVEEAPAAKPEEDVVMEEVKDETDDTKMQVDEPKKSEPSTPTERKEDFYTTFWSLQLPFSKPALFALPKTFDEFKDAVSRVLPVIKEATAKERLMMGSRAGGSGSLKRKREVEPLEEGSAGTEYFFAKFLTSPELLELEIADTHFRRQFLFQLAILLTHLQTFTKAAKASWTTIRNRSLQMDFTLDPGQAEWVQEMLGKVHDELKQTTPNGRTFAETVSTILERERNWVKWKADLCNPFDKEPWSTEVNGESVGLFESTRELRQKMRKVPDEWDWALGTEALTEVWNCGYRELRDVQTPFRPGDVKDFLKQLQLNDKRTEMRKKKLAVDAERIAQQKAKLEAAKAEIAIAEAAAKAEITKAEAAVKAEATKTESSATTVEPPNDNAEPAKPVEPPAPAPLPATFATDSELQKLEENKQRITWLALRTARDVHLQHFVKIGTGDVELLAKEIEEAEKKAAEPVAEAPAEEAGGGDGVSVDTQASQIPAGDASAPGEDISMGDR